MRYWFVILSIAIMMCMSTFILVYHYRTVFTDKISYIVTLFIFGISTLLMFVISIFKNDKLNFMASYYIFTLLFVPFIGYIIIKRDIELISLVMLIPAILTIISVYIRYGELKMSDYIPIFLTGSSGFWIIIIKFSWIGLISIFFAIFAFLSVVLIGIMLFSETDPCDNCYEHV